MARRTNELFIGRNFLNVDGRSIKHHALIKEFANVNVNKISDTKIVTSVIINFFFVITSSPF